MRNNYLIPANSKKSQLILNAFRGVDLIWKSVILDFAKFGSKIPPNSVVKFRQTR